MPRGDPEGRGSAATVTMSWWRKRDSVLKLKGGTTAVVALVREKRLVVAWLGDSQALLVRRRSPVRMVEPHKPELPVSPRV
ncbi:Protein phosphatase 1F [Portunus trituberculatus]|uniref:Protein phosphatase 1F n=1 Tax=Portunus trituberculatus TaxID=210409 RepID=A0A5B7KB09_PORTR|nr:Protein phosphatase 1F [Portunus trituberculatus]